MKQIIISLAYIVIGIILMIFGWGKIHPLITEVKPINATHMTAYERGEIDNSVLLKYLKPYGANKVDVHYNSTDTIDVYINVKSSEQYANKKAQKVKDAFIDILKEHRSELTLEKDPYDYLIWVNGSDDSLLD